jgi:hypothetical protein
VLRRNDGVERNLRRRLEGWIPRAIVGPAERHRHEALAVHRFPVLHGVAVFADEFEEEVDAAGDVFAIWPRRLVIVASSEERQDRKRRGRGPRRLRSVETPPTQLVQSLLGSGQGLPELETC